MLFSEQWLRSLINIPYTSNELAHTLTMAGLEVESRTPVAPAFSGVVVAKVLSVEAHPNAERLSVCRVDIGQTEPVQIVCGAKNVCADLYVPCATVGAVLPGNFAIKAAKLRGIDSFGMLCSAKELGGTDEVDGLLVLPNTFKVGQCIREALSLDDLQYVLKITPNRADCLSMRGLCQELTALHTSSYPESEPLKHQLPEIISTEIKTQNTPKLSVQYADDNALTPLFTARLIENVDNTQPTPLWMKQRLERSGMRSIHLIADITNYVMLEQGQPLHAYDYQKIEGTVSVKYATEGESIRLLNHQDVSLHADTIVIADEKKTLGLAGVMGSEYSGVSNTTTQVMLESAYWHPTSVAGKARDYNLTSEAAHRFERGVDAEQIIPALERATNLICELAGGQASDIITIKDEATLPFQAAISLRSRRIERILGFHIPAPTIVAQLESLGCQVETQNGHEWAVIPPSWRVDIEREIDLIEELARLSHYDALPTQAPTPPLTFLSASENVLSLSELGTRCVAANYQEAISFSFVKAEYEQLLNPTHPALPLLNPISQEMGVMRTTLWSGLLPALQNNVRRKIESVRFFEIGRAFLSIEHQPLHLAGLAYGLHHAEQWGEKKKSVDFFDVKNDLQNFFKGRILTTQRLETSHPALHPGRSAQIMLDGEAIGIMGELHPQLLKTWDLSMTPILFEVELTPYVMKRSLASFRSLSDLPSVKRDLALIAPKSLPAQSVLDTVKNTGLKYLKQVELFDVFEGGTLDTQLKSLAIRLYWQPETQMLTDADIQNDVQQLLERLSCTLKVSLRT